MPKNHPSQLIDTTQDQGLSRKFNPEIVIDQRCEPISEYKFNVAPDRLDRRDYIFGVERQNISSTVDLRRFCSKVEDQGPLGSCTGHAVSCAMELLLNRERRLTELSRLFIYYNARMLLNTVNIDSGAYIRDAIKSVNRWGASSERLWSYNTRLFKTRPPPNVYEDAFRRRATEYRRCTDFDGVRGALNQNYPVVVGYLVYHSFLSMSTTRTGIMSYPNVKRETLLGGHAVCLVGYDDRRQVFIAKNSWGSRWGDRGYFYMPYKVIQDRNMSMDFWTITGVMQ